MNRSASMLTGERVLWSGEPCGGLYFQPMDIFLVPFSLVWCGFAIFWTVTATGIGAPSFFDLWGLMFVVIGLYFVFGRFLVDMWVRSGTSYTLTSRRVLIERGGPFPRQIVISLADLPPVEFRESRNSRGTIRFGEVYGVWSGARGFGAWSPSLNPTPQFIKIENARDIFDLLNRARDELLRTTGSGS